MDSVKRDFISVGSRHVHYLRSGSGPVVILFHDSPRSSELNRPLINALADQFDVIAFDTPGFGLSDPMPGDTLTVPELADAWSETFSVLGIERALVYGTHGSAKVACELSLRHPEQIAAVVLDGITIPIGASGSPPPDLIAPFKISEDGSHLTSLWFRMREQSNFYPPSNRSATTRLQIKQPSADALHQLMVDMLNAGPRYGIVYEAVIKYSPVKALSALSIPALVTARADDVSYGSLQRLPEIAPTTRVLPLPADEKIWLDAIKDFFLEYRRSAHPIKDMLNTNQGASQISYGYVGEPGQQLRFRRKGHGPQRTLVLLHSPPGGGAQLGELLASLNGNREVIALDLPGCGDSDALEADAPSIEDYATSVLNAIDSLCPHHVDLFAEGLAVPLALEIAALAPNKICNVICDGGLHAEPIGDASSLSDWCPDMTPRFDGAHWVAAWYMLREQELRWPWFDETIPAIRQIEPVIDAECLHRRTLDTLKRPQHYRQATHAALQFDGQQRLPDIQANLFVLIRSGDPYHAWPDAADEKVRMSAHLKPEGTAALADLIDKLTGDS